jgi:RNA polymerase sigma factor (sigma-70 family)
MPEPEAVLLARYAQNGDPDAFRSLVEVHQHMVYAACHRILGNRADAEDAAQNCMFKLATKASKLKAPIAGWLHRVAVTGAIDMLRQRRARREREAKAAGDAARVQPKELSWEEIKPQVDEAIAALPKRLRVPVVLYYLEQRKQEEIAAELGISQPAVSGRLKRGVEELQKRFERSGLVGGAAVLGTVLYANSAEAAPAGLVASVGKMGLAGAVRLYSPVAKGGGAAAVLKVCAVVAVLLICAAALGMGGFAAYRALKPEQREARVVVAHPREGGGRPDGSGRAAGSSALAESTSQDSGPARSFELVLNEDGGGTNMFLDLDIGRLYTIPPDVAELDAMLRWMRQEGIDLLYSRSMESHRLIGADLTTARAAARAWETASAEAFRNAHLRAAGEQFPILLGLGPRGEDTFFFMTREGSVGVLQILGFGKPEPGSAQIRYRILDSVQD